MQTWVSQMRMRELFSRNRSLTNTTILRKDARVGKHLIFIMIQACDEVFFWKSSVFISFFFFSVGNWRMKREYSLYKSSASVYTSFPIVS